MGMPSFAELYTWEDESGWHAGNNLKDVPPKIMEKYQLKVDVNQQRGVTTTTTTGNQQVAASLGESKAMAIEVCQPTGERDYLSRLYCPNGTAVNFKRTGSVGSRFDLQPNVTMDQILKPILPGAPDYHIVDAYSITCGSTTSTLYLDMYHCDKPEPTIAPRGFSLGVAPRSKAKPADSMSVNTIPLPLGMVWGDSYQSLRGKGLNPVELKGQEMNYGLLDKLTRDGRQSLITIKLENDSLEKLFMYYGVNSAFTSDNDATKFAEQLFKDVFPRCKYSSISLYGGQCGKGTCTIFTPKITEIGCPLVMTIPVTEVGKSDRGLALFLINQKLNEDLGAKGQKCCYFSILKFPGGPNHGS